MRRVLLAALALSACMPPPRPSSWVPTEPAFVAPRAGYELVPPPGWMRLASYGEVFFITRDGSALQRIVAGASRIGKPIGLGEGKRPVLAGMSPQELAELVVDDMRAVETITDLRVVESAPAALAGRSGFRVVAAYRSASGLGMRVAFHGLTEGGSFYRVAYVAPERHYFARDLPVFEEVVRSFRLRPAVPAPAPARVERPR